MDLYNLSTHKHKDNMAKKQKSFVMDTMMSSISAEAAQTAASRLERSSVHNAASAAAAASASIQPPKIEYDDVCKPDEELVRLSEELAAMTDKVAGYLETIDELKSKCS